MPKVIRQTNSPSPFSIEELGKNHWNIVQAQLSNEISVVRYLTSKIIFTEENLTLEEISILFLGFEEIVRKSARDKLYSGKYLQEIFIFRAIFQSLDALLWMEPKHRFKLMKSTYDFYRGKFLSRRYYYSVKGQIQKLYDIRVRTRFPKKFKPKAYIGKGYGDHGTAKEPAYDGCLSWQEVAGARLFRVESETVLDREIGIFQNFKVHQLQLYVVK